MPSAIAHSWVAVSFGSAAGFKARPWRVWLLGILGSVLPDVDVLAFRFGIPYGAFWGHRGFTHSLCFAFLLALVLTLLFFRKESRWFGVACFVYLFLATASHGLLDALTDGGLGVAFFSPFNDTRYFFPWRPIHVSPLSVSRFLSVRGLGILQNEALWVGVPCLVIMFFRWLKRGQQTNGKIARNEVSQFESHSQTDSKRSWWRNLFGRNSWPC
jgi:inner membrane protein